MSDRELLELAAKAAGMEIEWRKWVIDPKARTLGGCCFALVGTYTYWNPLEDDGDALRLAVQLNLGIRFSFYDSDTTAVFVGGDWDEAPEAVHELFYTHARDVATRRAIVRAAAEIGRNMT
jgi:hypothetical protein